MNKISKKSGGKRISAVLCLSLLLSNISVGIRAQDTVFRYSGTTLQQSGTTLAGATGVEPISSGDLIVVKTDIQSGGTVQSTSDLTVTIESNDSSVMRTINGGADSSIPDSGSPIISATGNLSIIANQIQFDSGSYYSTPPATGNANSWGAALFANGGTLNLSGDAVFSNNRAVSIGNSNVPAYATGGAIDSERSSVTITGNHSFYNNSVYAIGLLAGAYGGAVTGTQSVSVSGSGMYSGNQTTGVSTGTPASVGLACGGAIASYSGPVTVSGTFVFQNNTATGQESSGQQTPGYGLGGAIGALTNDIVLTGQFTFENNQTVDTFLSSAYGGALYAAGSVTLSGADSNMSFSGNASNGQPNDIYTDASTSVVSITNGGTYYFGGGISTAALNIGETAPQNGNPTVIFGAYSISTIQPVAATMTANLVDAGFITAPDPVDPTVLAGETDTFSIVNANLVFEISNNFADRGPTNPYINATGVGTIAVDGVNTVSFDESTLTTTQPQTAIVNLIQGSAANSAPLNLLPQGAAGETLLAAYETDYDAPDNRYILTLTLRDSSLVASEIGGNAPGLVDALGAGTVLGNQTSQAGVVSELSARSGETIASAASVMVYKLNYFNQTRAARAVDNLAGGCMKDSGFGFAGAGREPSVSACEPISNDEGRCTGTSESWFSANNRSAWISGYGLGASSQFNGNISSYNFQSGGILTGIDWGGGRNRRSNWFSEGFESRTESVASVWFGYGQTGIQSSRTNLSSKDYSFGGLLGRQLDPDSGFDFGLANSYGLIQGGFQFNNFDGTHAGLTETTDADFNAWESTVYGEYGLLSSIACWNSQPSLRLNPFVAFQYISYRGDVLEIENLSLGQTKLDSVQTILGVRLRHEFCPSGFLPTNASLSTTLAWRRELSDDSGRFAATGANGTGILYGNSSGRDWMELSCDVSAALTKRIAVSGNYYLFANGASCLNAGMGTLTLKY